MGRVALRFACDDAGCGMIAFLLGRMDSEGRGGPREKRAFSTAAARLTTVQNWQIDRPNLKVL